MSNIEHKSENESEQNTMDPSIDITSEHFDPLKALYSENVAIPYKNAKVYDNISKYESCVVKTKVASNEATTSNKTDPTDSTVLPDTRTNARKTNFNVSNEPITRRFLPHQRIRAL